MSHPAGWYPDPGAPGGGGLRWFDGQRWTEHLSPAPPVQPASPAPGWAGSASAPTGPGTPDAGVDRAAVPQPAAQQQQQPTVPQPAASQPWGATAPSTRSDGRPASMFGPRKGLMVALGVFLLLRVVATVSQDGVGGLVGVVVGVALVAGIGVPLFLRARRRNGAARVAEAQAAGQLEGALWVGYVQRTPPNATNPFAAFRPSFYRAFASGLLVVREGGVRFLPGPRAVRNGHRPWALDVGQIEAVEARRMPTGAFLYLRPRGGAPLELGLQGGGGAASDFTAALGHQGVPVV